MKPNWRWLAVGVLLAMAWGGCDARHEQVLTGGDVRTLPVVDVLTGAGFDDRIEKVEAALQAFGLTVDREQTEMDRLTMYVVHFEDEEGTVRGRLEVSVVTTKDEGQVISVTHHVRNAAATVLGTPTQQMVDQIVRMVLP